MGAPNCTPGPWFVSTSPVLAVVAQEDNPVIAEITAVGEIDHGVEFANAHQLAASGALYDALDEFVREYVGFEDGNGYPCPTRERAIAALALARGETAPSTAIGSGDE